MLSDIKTVGVVGAGTMGFGIALNFALAGYPGAEGLDFYRRVEGGAYRKRYRANGIREALLLHFDLIGAHLEKCESEASLAIRRRRARQIGLRLPRTHHRARHNRTTGICYLATDAGVIDGSLSPNICNCTET